MYQLFLRVLALAAAVHIAAARAETVAPPVVTFDEAASQAWIAMPDPDVSKQIVIPVMLNGHVEQALLDTGVSRLTIDSRRAAELGLKPVPFADVAGFGGKVQVSIAPIETFDVGGIHQRGGAIGVADLSALIAASPHRFTVVLSADLLRQFAIDLDFDSGRMRIRRSGSRWATGSDLPLTIKPSNHNFLTTISVDGHRITPAVLDTGDNDVLTIDSDIAGEVLSDQPVTDMMALGAGGTYVARLFHAHTVALGAVTLKDVSTRVSVVMPDSGGSPARARIGLAFMKRFNVTLDGAAGRMTLAPRLRPPPPDPVSTSGIQGLYRPDGLLVGHVMHGSPAEAAGLQDGDRICQVDGTRVDASWSPAQRGWSIGAPGRRVVLTRCDGRTLSIVLGRFY